MVYFDTGPQMPIYPVLKNKVLSLLRQYPDFWGRAEEISTISSSENYRFPPAIHLPHQIGRIRRTIFGDINQTILALTSNSDERIGPTLCARFKDVILHDGVLYKKGAALHLRPRSRRLPSLRRPPTIRSGAIYDSWNGLRYFGNWLIDDCETYRLAETVGRPVTIHMETSGHRQQYEHRLGIAPLRTDFAHFSELFLFQDMPNSASKRARAADQRQRLLATIPRVDPHPGVFLMRGKTGTARVLINEEALAETLAERYGFRVLRILDHPVEELIKACAGAKVLVGVEGSQLVHALAVMPPGGTVLALIPPDRVTAALKLMTDRLGLNFAFVIGEGATSGFHINLNEIEATLELLP